MIHFLLLGQCESVFFLFIYFIFPTQASTWMTENIDCATRAVQIRHKRMNELRNLSRRASFSTPRALSPRLSQPARDAGTGPGKVPVPVRRWRRRAPCVRTGLGPPQPRRGAPPRAPVRRVTMWSCDMESPWDVELELRQHIQTCACTCNHMGYGNYMDYQVRRHRHLLAARSKQKQWSISDMLLYKWWSDDRICNAYVNIFDAARRIIRNERKRNHRFEWGA